MEKVVAIVNPSAARLRGRRERERILGALRTVFPGLALRESGGRGAIAESARAAADADLVLAVGGDGTVSEAAAALAGGSAALGIVPAGAGDDFARAAGIPRAPLAACLVAREGRTRAVDLGAASWEGEEGARRANFINIAGLGFDARVAAARRRFPRLRGLPLYLAAVLSALRHWESAPARIRVAGREIERRVLLVAAANGSRFGGGLRIAPEARFDDGLLDLCIVAALSPRAAVCGFASLLRGTHVHRKEFELVRAPAAEIDFVPGMPCQFDGEVVAPAGARRLRFEVRPGAVRLRVGA
ncbi:MAG TPA: YegS/Rv2252/BmrU family lipid kinase [Planctomycetota bacterium]|nr:YegS/Rv2252/BmrU family lipid kinase [Planctomycetota bacterium]OQC21731.1 MAG: Diacylglycerol kinase [Planctomycetes bacterium ADurb.Bin069]HNR98889.1 YegS/Rv2252/BmrU family lipid kinase [Planctomycetota bacterium]HNU26036.1 YegS/Rv2252/BmrU family lipid kinase [Planctomycetota bacterium]HOE29701.1 YegS/Rv2252/BmrU family lipid kinase [Planctomycetota bacterium]